MGLYSSLINVGGDLYASIIGGFSLGIGLKEDTDENCLYAEAGINFKYLEMVGINPYEKCVVVYNRKEIPLEILPINEEFKEFRLSKNGEVVLPELFRNTFRKGEGISLNFGPSRKLSFKPRDLEKLVRYVLGENNPVS